MTKPINKYLNIYILYIFVFIVELILINSTSLDNWNIIYMNSIVIVCIVFMELYLLVINCHKPNLLILHPYLLTLIFTFLFSLGGAMILLMTINGRPLIFNGTFAQNVLYNNPFHLIKSTGLSILALISMITGYRIKIGKKLFILYYNTLKINSILNREVSISKFFFIFLFAYFVKFYLYANGLYGYQQLANEEFINSRFLVFTNLGFVLLIISGILSNNERYKNKLFFKRLYKIIFPLELIFALVHGARSPIIFLVIAIVIISLFNNVKIRKSFLFPILFAVLYAFTIGSEFKKFIVVNNKNESNPISSIYNFFQNRNEIKHEINQLNEAAIEASGIDNIAFYLTLSRFTYYSETALAIHYKDNEGLKIKDPPFALYTFLAPVFAIFPPYFLFNIESPKWGGWFYVNVEGKKNETSSSAFSPVGYLYLLGNTIAVIIGFLFFGIAVKFTSFFLENNSIGTLILFLSLLSITYNFDTNVSDAIIFFVRYTLFIPLIFLIFLAKNKSV